MKHSHQYFLELLEDIDRGKFAPLTSIKNIESVLAEFIDEYPDYDAMIKDLQEWNYLKLN